MSRIIDEYFPKSSLERSDIKIKGSWNVLICFDEFVNIDVY